MGLFVFGGTVQIIYFCYCSQSIITTSHADVLKVQCYRRRANNQLFVRDWGWILFCCFDNFYLYIERNIAFFLLTLLNYILLCSTLFPFIFYSCSVLNPLWSHYLITTDLCCTNKSSCHENNILLRASGEPLLLDGFVPYSTDFLLNFKQQYIF